MYTMGALYNIWEHTVDSRPESREIVPGAIPKPVNPVHTEQYGNVWTCFTCPIEYNGSTAAGIGFL